MSLKIIIDISSDSNNVNFNLQYRRGALFDFLDNTRSFDIFVTDDIQSLLLQTQQFLLVGHVLPGND